MNDLDTRPVRFGIIGAGSIARRFAQSLAHVPGATLAGVWARRADAAAAFCATCGGTPAASLDALLAADLDAVYIATLHDSHAQYALAALAAGKAVLCEKPATLNAAQLDTVLRAARDAGQLFMEAMKPPFFPLYRQLRARLREDPIGEIRLVRAGCASSSGRSSKKSSGRCSRRISPSSSTIAAAVRSRLPSCRKLPGQLLRTNSAITSGATLSGRPAPAKVSRCSIFCTTIARSVRSRSGGRRTTRPFSR
ncbi:oxidoreductase [Burkholderia sp. TJI49]|nr:oxidoreductase [Burkholderia sp. TJI49]